ncbi:hypothetical protein [Dechloromonas denitrificans]|uniref:hypothetical protein n=1 Tax=Azonexaceae TaxID=2008795 RepID=UPI001CF8DCCF|nr:hypothetical protein [Dechloromonas denitrificans]UCV04858.1 hypothetical protein KI611_06250 [Dechloromonas denitrificans]UCV09239.1 hypothetical protein KI615_06855 [Dechloromonas denitrificans]
MSIKSFFAHAFGQQSCKDAETVDYASIFNGEADAPLAIAGDSRNFLPGLRPLKNDVDAYFKDVFINPVF